MAAFLRIFPLKLSGFFLLLGAGVLLYYFGFLQQDLILLMASVVLLVVACLSVLLVCEAAFATHRWWRAISLELPAQLTPLLAGVPGRMTLLRRPPWRPLVEVSWRWIEPTRVETRWSRGPDGDAYEEFTFDHRCLIYRVEREFEISDVLGFACIRFRRVQDLRFQVLPAPRPLDRSAFVTSFHGGDDLPDPRGEPVGDRVDMRQYAAGDPPKLMLWKLYARTGKLMVRMPERAISPTPRTCAYLVAGPQDEAAAGLMRSILESGVLGPSWRFGADGNQGHCETVDEAMTFLARSGNVSLKGGWQVELRSFLAQAAKDGFNGCLVALPSVPGKWLDDVRGAARVSGIEVSWAVAPANVTTEVKRIPLVKPSPAWWDKVKPWLLTIPAAQQPGEPEKVLQGLAGLGKERWIYKQAAQGFVRYGGKGIG